MRHASFVQHLRPFVAILMLLGFFTPFAQAQRLLEPSECLKDPKFKELYLKALGTKAKTPGS